MSATTYTKAQILKDVRIILDQNETNDVLSTLSDTDQLQTNDIIEKCLQFAIDRVLDISPLWMLKDIAKESKKTPSKRYNSTSFVMKYGKVVEVPEDFFRPVSVLCSDWEQPVRNIESADDPSYQMMKSPLQGVRGNKYSPRVFLTVDPTDNNGVLFLEIYDTNAESVQFIYIPKISVSSSMLIPELIYQSIIYTTANLYYTTLGNADMAKLMADEAADALRIHTEAKS